MTFHKELHRRHFLSTSYLVVMIIVIYKSSNCFFPQNFGQFRLLDIA
jgi:hypothetical protein